MDTPLVAAGFIVPLVVALAWAIWFLVARCQTRQRQAPTRHVFRGQGEAVTVAELLEEAAERGDPVQLDWPLEDLDDIRLVRPYARDQFRTIILPRLEDIGDENEL